MLELFGRGYVIEHCISSLKSNNEEKSFKIYITDALMAIAGNTTGADDYRKIITSRWIERMNPQKEEEEEPEDDRPSDEIASDIWERIRGH